MNDDMENPLADMDIDNFLDITAPPIKQQKIEYIKTDIKIEPLRTLDTASNSITLPLSISDTDSSSSDSVPDKKQKLLENDDKELYDTQPINVKIRIYDLRQSKTTSGFECPDCSKVFRDSSNLLKHIRCHTQEKPYTCQYCRKAFAHSSTLKGHLNIHTKAKPFLCEFPSCGKAFANSSNLSRHKRVHTGEKPYKCKVCHKRFNQSSNLKQHAKTHQ